MPLNTPRIRMIMNIKEKKHSHSEVIHEASPSGRPLQKVVHASLDVGAREDGTDPGAVY